MANEKNVTDIGLTVSGPGVLDPNTKIENLLASGFSEERTIKISDPAKGDAVMAYAGELIGPGPEIELNESMSTPDGEPRTLSTWMFHPLNIKTLEPVHAVTHSVIAPHQLDNICKKAMQLKLSLGKRVQLSIMWVKKGENRLGQPLNIYRSAHRLLNDDGSVMNESKPEGIPQRAAAASK